MDYLFGSVKPVSKAELADIALRKAVRETRGSAARTIATEDTLQKLCLASNDLRERVDVQRIVLQDHVPRSWGALDQATRASASAQHPQQGT